jgi:hypothetical protein
MTRLLIGLIAVWVFAGGFGPTASSACSNEFSPQKSCKPCKRPDGSLNNSPNVTSMVLDRNELRLVPKPQGEPLENADHSPDMIINVATNATDAENDVLDYYYTISGGRVVGTGSSVKWDLNGVPPGTYTITAKVDDSCGICGKTITKGVMIIGKMPIVAAAPSTPPVTKLVTPPSTAAPSPAAVNVPLPAVAARPVQTVTTRPQASSAAVVAASSSSSVPCSCPKIIISDPERSDSDLIFTTKIFDLSTTNRLTYIWTITGGTVISQDGRSIRVKPGVLGGSVTVSVNGLDPKCSCPDRAQKIF